VCVTCNAFHQLSLLLARGCCDALLHNTATVLVASNLHVLPDHRVVDKLSLRRVTPSLEDLLEHVITVNIMGQDENFVIKVRCELAGVLRKGSKNLDNLLDSSGSVHALAKLNGTASDLLDH